LHGLNTLGRGVRRKNTTKRAVICDERGRRCFHHLGKARDEVAGEIPASEQRIDFESETGERLCLTAMLV